MKLHELDRFDARDLRLDYEEERKEAHQHGVSLTPGFVSGLSGEEKLVLSWYRDEGAKFVNNPNVPDSMKVSHLGTLDVGKARSIIDGILEKSSIPQDIVVYKGIIEKKIADQILRKETGATFVHPGYVSTTLHYQYAINSFSLYGSNVVLRIHVPAGTPGFYVSEEDGYEVEVLLGRGLVMKMIGSEKIGHPDKTLFNAPVMTLVTIEVTR